jgi:hypothetical protein
LKAIEKVGELMLDSEDLRSRIKNMFAAKKEVDSTRKREDSKIN